MAMTVTATMSGTAANEHIYLWIRVLTGATEAGGASAAGVNASGGTAISQALTPNGTNSLPCYAVTGDNDAATYTALANCTVDSTAIDPDTWGAAFARYTGTVTGGTPLTFGVNLPGGGADNYTWACYEVLASAGSTPAVDGSSPALASATGAGVKTVTSASFTPPPGSVVVAMIAAGGGGTSGSFIMSVSGGGLAWTQRAGTATVADQDTFVFTATVPAGGPVPQAAPGRTWLRRFRHRQELPSPPLPAAAVPPAGSQPHGYGSSRRSIAAVFGGVASPPLPSPAGTAPDHLVVARRTAARAVVLFRPVATVNAAPSSGPAGTTPDHLVVARRTAARAYWRGWVSATTNLLNGNDPGGGVYRRRAARAVIRGGPAPFPPPSGTTPDHLVIARRAPARAVWRGYISATTNLLYGNQPGAGLVKRRQAARAVWRPTGTRTTNLPYGNQPGGLTRRRTAARGVWAGTTVRTVNTAPASPAGQQPHGFISSRRPVGGLAGGAYTPTPNASGPAGTTPAHLVIARRAAARAVWAGTTVRTANITPTVPGTAPDHLVVARRAAARVVWAGTTVRTVNVVPTVSGAAPDHLVVARRAAARAVVHGTAPVTVNAQAPAPPPPAQRVIIPRRGPARAVARGNPVPGQPAKPATGGLIRRRSAARGLWHGVAGAPPPAGTPGAPAAGKSVTTRRPPNRGQWHGTTVRTTNPIPVAVAAPRARAGLPRRATARGVWRGGAGRVRPQVRVLITVTGARQPWQVTGARQQWQATTARQLWHVPEARN